MWARIAPKVPLVAAARLLEGGAGPRGRLVGPAGGQQAAHCHVERAKAVER